MKFLLTTKKKAMAKSNGESGQVGLPLPRPPFERYSLPVGGTQPLPLRAVSLPLPGCELRITSPLRIPAGKNDAVPLSPKMVTVLGADGKEEEKKVASSLKLQKNPMWRWPQLPSDLDLCNNSVPSQRDSASAHAHSSFTQRGGCNSSRPAMLSENSNGSSNRSIGPGNRSPASAVRGSASANRSVPNGFRAQEFSTVDWRSYRNSDVDRDLNSSPPYQLSSSTRDLADASSAEKASLSEVSRCPTPLRSPRQHLVSSQGKPTGTLHESYHKPCKLPSPNEFPPPSPTRPSHQLDRRTQTLSSNTVAASQHDLGSRPRSLPTPHPYRETSPRRLKITPPASPHRPDHKLAPASPSPRKPTSPASPLQSNSPMHLENEDYTISPWNSPQRSYHDSPCSTSPLRRFLQPVPKPPQRWKRGAKIGSGSFGCVYEGWNLDDGTFFAVKVSNGDNIPPEIHQEVAVLSKLRHPNIVQYYGTTTENGSICIFLELVKMGSLQSIMKNFQVFDEVLMSSYTRQILTGLEYLHDMNTIHRDIKCANILVDSDGQVKLADFGLAKQMKDSLATSIKGSPYYMAPEVLLPGRNKRPYGLAVDIWSLGCTVLEMADGKPPWSGLQGYAFFFKVTNGELPPIPEHLSDRAKDFIIKCLQKCPEDRPPVKDLLKHPFVTQAPRTFRASFPVGDLR